MIQFPLLAQLAALAALVVSVSAMAAPAVTAAPKVGVLAKRIDPFATDVDFIGYYSAPGATNYSISTCDGGNSATFNAIYASTRYYGGCTTAGFGTYYTACSGSYAVGKSYSASTVSGATTTSTSWKSVVISSTCNFCITDLLQPVATAVVSFYIQCLPSSRDAYTILRTWSTLLPPLAVVSSTAPSTSASSSSLAPPRPSSTTSSAPVTATAAKDSSLTGGAIAGIVIGGIATLALIIGLTFLVLLKKRRGTSSSALPVLVPAGPAGPPEKHLSTDYTSMLGSPGSPSPQYNSHAHAGQWSQQPEVVPPGWNARNYS